MTMPSASFGVYQQRKEYRRASLQSVKMQLLDALPFDWMTQKSNEGVEEFDKEDKDEEGSEQKS